MGALETQRAVYSNLRSAIAARSQRCAALEHVVRGLEGDFGRAWARPVAAVVDAFGFGADAKVDAIALPACQLAVAAQFFRHRALHGVRLSSLSPDARELDAVDLPRGVQRLDVSGSRLDAAGHARVVLAARAWGVTELSLADTGLDADRCGVLARIPVSSLLELDVSRNPMGRGTRHLFDAGWLASVRVLDLTSTALVDDPDGWLLELLDRPFDGLHLGRNTLTAVWPGLAESAALGPQLRRLSVEHCGIHIDHLQHVLTRATALEEVRFSLDDEDLAALDPLFASLSAAQVRRVEVLGPTQGLPPSIWGWVASMRHLTRIATPDVTLDGELAAPGEGLADPGPSGEGSGQADAPCAVAHGTETSRAGARPEAIEAHPRFVALSVAAQSALETASAQLGETPWTPMRLDFRGIQFSEASARALLANAHLSHLTSLSLTASEGTEHVLRVLGERETPALRVLSVRRSSCEPAVLREFLRARLADLRALTLVRCGSDDALVAQLAECACPRLESLHLADDGLSGAAVHGLACAPSMMGLRSLTLDGIDLREDGAAAIAVLLNTRPITWLSLHRTLLGDAEVLRIVGLLYATRLRVLGLASNFITDTGARALSSCSALASLTCLRLSYNGDVGAAGACALIDSAALPSLRRLELFGTRVRAYAGDRANVDLRC